ncbi:unnamed protein product [Blepharisma stoltei]|uniref:Uncharacterized protein n=1 Tax=Blepharisma stoltei TaxID=1481888 RepID=A0AAU9IFZ7_9CILI|nr:unnamed protein product [Blepharisma stoltei]
MQTWFQGLAELVVQFNQASNYLTNYYLIAILNKLKIKTQSQERKKLFKDLKYFACYIKVNKYLLYHETAYNLYE